MVLATSNRLKQILWINYAGHVVPAELKVGREDIGALLADLHPGFRLMVNLSHVESMGMECREELGRNMDAISAAGVARVVRIIPDATKDPGLNILAFFHYRNHPQIVTCSNFKEAVQRLLS